MNNILIKASVIGLISTSLLLSPVAFAGHNHHHSNKHYSKKKSKHYSSYKKRHSNYKRKHNHVGHVIGGIIGGVVIGSILENASNKSHSSHHSRPHYKNTNYRSANSTVYSSGNYHQPVAVNKTIIINNTPTQTYRVLNGRDCYLVNQDGSGGEIMTQVPKVNCGF